MGTLEEDLELRRAEEEHKRTSVEIENNDGPRGNKAEREK